MSDPRVAGGATVIEKALAWALTIFLLQAVSACLVLERQLQ